MSERFKLKNSHIEYRGKVISLSRDELQLPTGKVVTKEIVSHPGAVVMVPLLSNSNLLLVKQYRHAAGDVLLEFPAGTLETSEDPLSCAKRELAEEVGHHAMRWTALGYVFSAPGFCSERLHLFLAQELTPHKLVGDEDEFIEICEMTIGQVKDEIVRGGIVDAKSIAAFAKAQMLNLL